MPKRHALKLIVGVIVLATCGSIENPNAFRNQRRMMKKCPECGRTIKHSPVNKDCDRCVRGEREITKLLEEGVAEGLIEHVGVDEYGQIVYRRTRA
jgi:uncharacterized OB-fold protein